MVDSRASHLGAPIRYKIQACLRNRAFHTSRIFELSDNLIATKTLEYWMKAVERKCNSQDSITSREIQIDSTVSLSLKNSSTDFELTSSKERVDLLQDVFRPEIFERRPKCSRTIKEGIFEENGYRIKTNNTCIRISSSAPSSPILRIKRSKNNSLARIFQISGDSEEERHQNHYEIDANLSEKAKEVLEIESVGFKKIQNSLKHEDITSAVLKDVHESRFTQIEASNEGGEALRIEESTQNNPIIVRECSAIVTYNIEGASRSDHATPQDEIRAQDLSTILSSNNFPVEEKEEEEIVLKVLPIKDEENQEHERHKESDKDEKQNLLINENQSQFPRRSISIVYNEEFKRKLQERKLKQDVQEDNTTQQFKDTEQIGSVFNERVNYFKNIFGIQLDQKTNRVHCSSHKNYPCKFRQKSPACMCSNCCKKRSISIVDRNTQFRSSCQFDMRPTKNACVFGSCRRHKSNLTSSNRCVCCCHRECGRKCRSIFQNFDDLSEREEKKINSTLQSFNFLKEHDNFECRGICKTCRNLSLASTREPCKMIPSSRKVTFCLPCKEKEEEIKPVKSIVCYCFQSQCRYHDGQVSRIKKSPEENRSASQMSISSEQATVTGFSQII